MDPNRFGNISIGEFIVLITVMVVASIGFWQVLNWLVDWQVTS